MRRACLMGAFCVLVLAVSMGGCSAVQKAQSSQRPRHILVVLIDTVRADHIGAYGYGRNTSPNIDRLAREGVVFEHARGNSTYTGEVVSAIFSGFLPTVNPAGTGWYAQPKPGAANMAQRFDAADYRTGCFTNSPVLEMEGYFDGFDETKSYALDFAEPPQTEALTNHAIDFMTRHKDGKTFTYLHYIEPHTPYIPPDEYVARFVDPAPPKIMNMSLDVQGHREQLNAEGFGPDDPRFKDLVLRYDAEIAMVDDYLGRLLDALDAQGILDDTLIVVTADHGEEFLEHGYFEHAWTLYDEVMHVPLIFWRPGMLEPGRRADFVSLVDLLPTLLEFAGLPGSPGDFDGAPLFLHDDARGWLPNDDPRPVHASLLTETRTLLHCVILGNLKYIAASRYLTPEECDIFYLKQRALRNTLLAGQWHPYNYWMPPKYEMLFDFGIDPGETQNVADSRPEDLARMRELLKVREERSANRHAERYAEEDRLTLDFVKNLPNDAGLGLPEGAGKSGPSQEARDALDALGYMGSESTEASPVEAGTTNPLSVAPEAP